MELDGRTIVLSGASGGVGLAISRHFRRLGAKVLGIDRTASPIAATGEILVADLCSYDGVVQVVHRIEQEVGELDILVNAAGTFVPDAEIDASHALWGRLWNDNVTSAVLLSRLLLPLLRKGHCPMVVNISSTDGIVASAGQSCEIGVSHDVLYATTKGALVALTKALAMAWAKYGIRVNAVCPTIISTPMTADLLAQPGKPEELKQFIPLSSLCTADDIAVAIESLYHLKMTTAHLLPVDGGYLCQ
jgi:NAD(P)-dependent dehydrogenase (short-subunit alcohol dehydrogenase family)